MKKITRKLIAAALAVALIGGTAAQASASKVEALRGIKAPISKDITNFVVSDVPLPALEQMQLRGICKKYNVPYCFALAVAETMTGFNDRHYEDGYWGERTGMFNVPANTPNLFPELEDVDIYSFRGNAEAGVYILRYLYDRHSEWRAAAQCYEVGESAYYKYILPYDGYTTTCRQIMARATEWFAIVGG